MTKILSFARFGATVSLCAIVASACGGKSFNNGGGDDDDDVTGTSGAAGVGGKKNKPPAGTAGNGATGGYGTGGSITYTAGSPGTSGAVGTGGSVGYNDPCNSPPDAGFCDAYIPSWYHDPSTGLCRPFVYGGCEGNSNRYSSQAECQKSCPATGMSFDLCKQPSECMLGGTGCCGVCDGPNLQETDFIAYNKQYAGNFQCAIALDKAAPPQGGTSSSGAAPSFPIPACAPCAPIPNGTAKYFQANCVQNRCVVEDTRDSAVTACKTSNECKLRYGSGCCEGCGGDLIAVRNDGSYEKLVCGGAPQPCPLCVPAPGGNDSGAIATCSEGHCAVAYLLK